MPEEGGMSGQDVHGGVRGLLTTAYTTKLCLRSTSRRSNFHSLRFLTTDYTDNTDNTDRPEFSYPCHPCNPWLKISE
jgi:hypothetical protein